MQVSRGALASKVTTDEKVWASTEAGAPDTGPVPVSFEGRLWVAWAGSDRRVNLMSSADGVVFDHKLVLEEKTSAQPGLAVHNGRLMVAWTGGDRRINVAAVAL